MVGETCGVMGVDCGVVGMACGGRGLGCGVVGMTWGDMVGVCHGCIALSRTCGRKVRGA